MAKSPEEALEIARHLSQCYGVFAQTQLTRITQDGRSFCVALLMGLAGTIAKRTPAECADMADMLRMDMARYTFAHDNLSKVRALLNAAFESQ